jgi:uncharacterized protein YfcZ (UPF0381/DUF406 family)
MIARMRKIGVKEKAEHAVLKSLREILREIEADTAVIAHLIVQSDSKMWLKAAKYFRNTGENIAAALELIDLLLGEYRAYEDELEADVDGAVQ